ncbi:MAG: hypothetical protein ACSHWW_10105 [Nonlabens sp.]|uniref:hypothetical protein n=1 Tax=Nonlabens sp. TaxID=1888209 RepID=UPI003EF91E37
MGNVAYIASSVYKSLSLEFVLLNVILFGTIVFLMLRQEINALRMFTELNLEKEILNKDIYEQQLKESSQKLLMNNELAILNKSFSKFIETNEPKLKQMQLFENARTCSIIIGVYHRIWNKI